MPLTEILLFITVLLLTANLILTISKRHDNNTRELTSELNKINSEISRLDPLIRNEFSTNRDDMQSALFNHDDEA